MNSTLANNHCGHKGCGGYNKRCQSNHSKWNNNNEKQEKDPQKKSSKDHKIRYDMKGH